VQGIEKLELIMTRVGNGGKCSGNACISACENTLTFPCFLILHF